MKKIYLTGNSEVVIDYFQYGSEHIKPISRTFTELTRTLSPSQALEVKKHDIQASELVVCCLTLKYVLTAEDIFTMSYAVGIGKQIAFVGAVKPNIPHIWPFANGPHLKFEDVYELIEYLRLDKR